MKIIKNMKLKYYSFLIIILITMIGFLFRESFMGLLLQGVDDNVSIRYVILRSLLSGQGYHFIPNYWLGFIFNVPNPDLYNTVLALTGSVRVVGVYMIALFLSGIVTFKLIRRLGVSSLSSIFGAISYTFLPHVLSLVYSGHALAIEAIPMTPAFLLCLSVILDGQTKSPILRGLAGIWGGIFWAWMMIGEPQRGTYGTVLGMAWVLFLLIQTGMISFKTKNINKIFPIKNLKKTLPYLLLIVIVGLSIFLSTIKFWTNSEFLVNQGSWEFATSWSFPPTELIDTLAFGYHGLSSSIPEFPYFGDKPMSGNTDSLGFFLLVFAILGMVFAWKSNKVGLCFFTIAGLVALLLSFGKYFPGTFFFWLWYQIPGMDTMRVPAKFLSITGLSWSIVAAIGMDQIKEIFEGNKEKLKKIILISVGVVAILSVLWFALLFLTDGQGFDMAYIRNKLGRANRQMIDAALTGRINAVLNMVVLFIGLVVIFYVMDKYPKTIKFMPIVIILLTIQNLYTANRFYIERTYVDQKEFYAKTELINFLEENLTLAYRASGSLFLPNVTGSPNPMGSVVEQHLYPLNNNNLTYDFPYYDINMFGRIPVSRLDEGYLNFFKSAFNSVVLYQNYNDVWDMNKRLWYMGNVKYLLVGQENENVFAEQLARDTIFVTNLMGSYNQSVAIYELNHKLPRFALINNTKSVDDINMLSEMENSLQDLSNYVLPLEDAGYGINESVEQQNPIALIPTRNNYNSYEITLNNTEDTVFYFGDLYDEGWKALLDGQEISIERANIIQQYLPIPAGSQKLEIFYNRPVLGFRNSLIFILLVMIATLVIWFVIGRKEELLIEKE